ncbi:unnamed protein product [Effrenium voratum]|uniref:Laminin EGF-like domain-containing protein n=1 Tax=Effrenium voratum TaxID=2562239 RepID=A0AA36IWE3_9DINO|nr:unnamed protein product [Effrenium voratum]CAJ1455276.1 unnamed protein product [Effrenium voratum]
MLATLAWIMVGPVLGSHPMAPTCHGFGGIGASCSAAGPGDSGKRRGSSLGDKTLAVKVSVLGCFSKPCWLQNIRVGVDDSNSVASLAKVGVYLSDGTLVASSQARDVPTSLPDHQWLAFAFRGHDKELRTTSEQDYVWLVVNTENSVKLTYENADSGDEATRTVSELFAGAFVAVRIWDTEPGRRQWAGHFRNLRVQMDLGDVSILPGTLPLILESPHGGRITEGWPTRVTGVLDSDRNTDLFTEELWSELGARCGRTPVAVIFRVARKGIDANRATGSGTHTRGGELCADQSNSQCCCDLASASDEEVAMDLNDVYHSLLSSEVAGANGALLVPIHGTGRDRVELGVRLSASDLNQGAGLAPPSLADHDSDSSLRALGNATYMIWGTESFGSHLKNNRPSMEVIPSSKLLCPDPNLCSASSYTSIFNGGYNLKIHITNTQPGVQVEMPQVMRGFWSSPPAPEAAAVKQVGAALASFLNLHYQESCQTHVNFGLACGSHGQAVSGTCMCEDGYEGSSCGDCAEGYLLVTGQCMRLVVLGPPPGVTEKYGSAFATTSSGRPYLYTRKFSTDLTDCGTGCQPLDMSVRIRCDDNQCHSDLDSSSYTLGAALFDAAGHKMCNGTAARSAQAATDWWLQIPLASCPLLQNGNQDHVAVYLALWTSKLIKIRWEQEPALSARSRGLQYKTADYYQDPSAQSFEHLIDAVPPAQLPSWRDLSCESPSHCGTQDSCDCISGCTCRSWSGNFYGMMATLSMQPA